MSENKELTCKTENSSADCTSSVKVRPQYTSEYNDDAWLVKVSLPGAARETISAEVEQEILDIRAHRQVITPDGWKRLSGQDHQRDYVLRLDVGPEVDASQSEANFTDGVLTLKLPLRDEVKPISIEVK